MAKAPQQERAKARVDRMLSAFGTLVDEVGLDAVTTTMVAAESGSAVGSFYQFFHDKNELTEAYCDRLAGTVVSTTKAFLDKTLATVAPQDKVTLVDCLVALHHAMEAVHRHEAGAKHLPIKAAQIAQELTDVFQAYSALDADVLYPHVLVGVVSSAACCKAAFADPAQTDVILGLCQWGLQEFGKDA